MRTRTGSFDATDEGGNRYRIIEYTEILNAATYTVPNRTVAGLKEYRLQDGSNLNKVNDAEFEIVASGQHIRVTA